MKERPLPMSLSADAPAREVLRVLSRFWVDFYDCLYRRADALFERTDAILCADGPVKTLVELCLEVEHRGARGPVRRIGPGRLEPTRLRRMLTGLPLPRVDDGPGSCWPWMSATGSARTPRPATTGCSATYTGAETARRIKV